MQTFETANTVYKKSIGLSKFVITLIVIAYILSTTILGYLLYDAKKTAIVFDSKGARYNAESVNVGDMRIYEYEEYIRNFYTTWYSFDENNFDQHIEKGLHMIGDEGKELFNEYSDLQLKSNMIQKNLRYEVKITNVVVNMSTKPVSGHIEGIQTCLRAKGYKSRTICVNFTIGDVEVSKDNLMGCRIDKWKVYESKELAEKNDSIAAVSSVETATVKTK